MDQSTFGSSGGRPSNTGSGIVAQEVSHALATKQDPDSVTDKPLYMSRSHFDGACRSGSENRSWAQ